MQNLLMMRKKDFKCIVCNNTFATKSNMKKHIEAVHDKNKPFECNFCDKKFDRKEYLEIHIAYLCS